MRKPIAIMFNDVHLKFGNEKSIIEATKYMVKYAVDSNIKTIIFAGDLFDSRQFQRQSILRAFDTMLGMFDNAGLFLHFFAGNHDKTVYADDFSFLTIFRHYPNTAFYEKETDVNINGIEITFMPFWDDDILIPKLIAHKGGDLLISHFAMDGSVNLGHSIKKPALNVKLLSKWKSVKLGHYHNYVEITPNITHMASFMQNNYGETSDKGFAVIFDDLSHESIKGCFKEFKKISINVDTTTLVEIKEVIEQYRNSSMSVRIELSGSENKLKAIKKQKALFDEAGIDLKTKSIKKFDFDNLEIEMPEVIESYGKHEVEETFEKYCEKQGFDYEEGKVLLNEFFKKQGI